MVGCSEKARKRNLILVDELLEATQVLQIVQHQLLDDIGVKVAGPSWVRAIAEKCKAQVGLHGVWLGETHFEDKSHKTEDEQC